MDVFSHTLILKAFCVLDPMFNSGVVSCGLLMITIVCAHCYLIGLFFVFKLSSLLCKGLVTFFPTILCVFFALIWKDVSKLWSMYTFSSVRHILEIGFGDTCINLVTCTIIWGMEKFHVETFDFSMWHYLMLLCFCSSSFALWLCLWNGKMPINATLQSLLTSFFMCFWIITYILHEQNTFFYECKAIDSWCFVNGCVLKVVCCVAY